MGSMGIHYEPHGLRQQRAIGDILPLIIIRHIDKL